MTSISGKHTHKTPTTTLERPKGEENQLTFLKEYDFFVLIDRSGSMRTVEDPKEKITRWDIVKEQLNVVVKQAAKLDENGIDVCFFSTDTEWHENIESEKKVNKLFNETGPSGWTNLAKAMNEVFEKHFDRSKAKAKDGITQKSIVIVITDGIPNDGIDEVESQKQVIKSIVSATKKLSRKNFFPWIDPDTKKTCKKTTEIGIRFFQVGNDPKATEYLQKLDDELSEAKADIVDTGNIEELSSSASVREALINAIFD
jgi:uncharacterized protein YegL